ncbi:MAG: glycosyltransferase family 39 protein [Isosphaeraceae bacterium]|nr:glycosyltransferase family 39 protein [Isosphaeraceae bacterium]
MAIAALALRLYGLGQRHVVFDESVILDPEVLRLGLITYAQKLWLETTYNPGWPMLIWLVHRVVGVSTTWARVPSAVCGALTPVAFYALARQVGLSRMPALLAGSVLGAAIFQVEYGQQIMPHAALPLGACVCLWLVSRLATLSSSFDPRKALLLTAGLIATFGLMMFLHNSSLLLLPLLLGYLGWSVRYPVESSPGESPRGSRSFALCVWVACVLALGFVSLGWFIAKAGHSDWLHLRPFFMTTFREAPDRGIVSDGLYIADEWYVRVRPARGGTVGAILDGAYFTATRVFDLLYGQFRLRGEQQFTHGRWTWLLPLVMLLLVARGAVSAARDWAGRTASRWVVAAGCILAFIIVMSACRIFPLGGIRHLIVLSPLVVLTAAVGLQSTSRRLSSLLGALCLVWLVGDAASLPRYYRSTRDEVGNKRFAQLAQYFDTYNFVAADTICSEGSLRLAAAARPGGRMLAADDPGFARLTLEHKPFFACALHDSIFASVEPGKPPVASKRFRELAHPLVNLRDYRAIPIACPPAPFYWLAWTVYYMEPQNGTQPVEVTDVAQCRETGSVAPWAFVVRFSRPIHADMFNRDSVQLVSLGAPNPPLIPIDLHFSEPTRTLTVIPLKPLGDEPYLLALYRTIRDTEGHPLDAKGKAFYYHFPRDPAAGAIRVDRGWLMRAAENAQSSKL